MTTLQRAVRTRADLAAVAGFIGCRKIASIQRNNARSPRPDKSGPAKTCPDRCVSTVRYAEHSDFWELELSTWKVMDEESPCPMGRVTKSSTRWIVNKVNNGPV